MLSRLWIAFLISLSGILTIAWLVALMHEKDIRPVRDMVGFFKKQSKTGRVVFGIMFLAFWLVASIKPDDGGNGGDPGGGNGGSTNNVQMVIGPGSGLGNVTNVEVLPITSTNAQLGGSVQLENGNIGTGNISTLATLITSTNTLRTITADDFRRGFVMTRVGTDEAFDFAAPSNAVVCADWRAFGAATDWIYVALTNWAFRVATNDVDRLRIYAFGKIEPQIMETGGEIATNYWFAPFMASLGIARQANWDWLAESDRPSQLWHYVTPSNTLQITWQNALLDRDTDTPLSFQIEFRTDGQFTYRYDLSRCGALGDRALPDGIITNAVVGASFAGNDWTTNAIPTNVTSMTFYPLSAEDAVNPDPDNDGLATIDELFVYNTDPRHPDSDYDGLTDYEELFVYHTDPLDPYSAGGPHCDGLAVKIGDADPFAYPEGSTNTVLEHVFYSGTTNGAFAYPQSDNDTAILRVTVSGTGAGRLIVGDSVVPLVAPPQMRGVLSGNVFTLLLPVVKGETHPAYVYGDESLTVTLDSDDFAFGAVPTFSSFGYINFPNTQATPACIHDFNLRSRFVSLPIGKDAELLTATWTGGADVSVSNVPPRSAVINANFYAGSIKEVSYSLSHPQCLFGQTQYSQPVRFCPRPKKKPPVNPDPNAPTNPEDEYSDTPNPDDPAWFSSGDGDSSTSNDGEEGHWCCYWGTCGSSCECGCDCANNPGGGQSGGDENVGDNEDFDDSCPDHYEPYEECDYVHESEYSNTVQTVQHLNGVLYIREPPLYEPIYLDVPTEHTNCCPCPEHWENYVGVAYKSYKLNLVDSNGLPFDRTETSCYVNVAGVYPSSAVGDAEIAFTRNGDIYHHQHRTVLGVAIKGHQFDLVPYNALNPDFGYPMTVCTNVSNAVQMRLVTNVKLPDGHVRLQLANASGQFTVWYPDYHGGTYRKLLDTSSTRVKNLSMAYWKALMRRATNGDTPELPIYITSSTPGTVTLKFRYWNVIDDKLVEDEAVQCITSVRPPLRLDITRDGSIDDGDAAAWLSGRTFYYWMNEDKFSGDWINQGLNLTPNTWDFTVNGTFDLVNLFPVALDLSSFTNAWQGRVTYTIKPKWGAVNTFNYSFADVPWNKAGTIQTTNVMTTAGQSLSSASLTALPSEGYTLPYSFITSFSEDSGLMICEAKSEYVSLQVDIKLGEKVLYRYYAPMTILPVKQMYNWYNFRNYSGEARKRTSEHHVLYEEHNTKSLIFLHGANVNEDQAEVWGDVLFKRLWLSGMRADFYNVDWRSNIGDPANYQQNASNAFVVASQIVSTLTNSIPGEKIIMAHSLGNMVVSSMIQDYGLKVSKYLMCDSAVPSEAYYPANDVSIRVSQLVHPDWEEYPTNSWASNWHKLFANDLSDDRRKLGWPGRFSSVAQYAVNFYSTGDEVLELLDDNDIYVWTGITSGYVQYSWHHQELWKGRASANVLGGTTWSGWNIEENVLGVNKISVSEAQQMSPEDFKTNTVFYCYPSSMNSTNISLLVRAAHLTQGIPALTRPTGGRDLYDVLDWRDYFNMNLSVERQVGNDGQTITQGIQRPNGWPTRSKWDDRWLHSDMKDVSFFYNFKFYEKVIEKGILR